MTLTMSAALLLGAAVLMLCSSAGLRVWHALLCVLFGFYLASSPLAPAVTDLLAELAGLVTGR